MLGEPALAGELTPGKGSSHSALCAITVNSIEDWRITTNTFSRENFEAAVEAIVVRARRAPLRRAARAGRGPVPRAAQDPAAARARGEVPLLERHPFVFFDNVKFHHGGRLEEIIRSAGGVLFYLVPYCTLFSPLDNIAFGLVRRYFMAHDDRLRRMPFEQALNEALHCAVGPGAARMCYSRSGWSAPFKCPY
jgi:hypothetical protein